jgi:signal transduction histidine kinase
MSFKPRYLSKSIDLKLKIEKSIPLVLTDRVIIGEVFNNLISNAIKYTPEDESIIVSLQQKNSHILFTVKDTGYGIPTASQQFIFTKFFRANNIIAHDVTGTGLGLYFTRVLADKINSEVWFKSSEGKGTSFFFSIPISGNIAQDGKFKLEYASQ